MDFSGRTACEAHINDNWEGVPCDGLPAITNMKLIAATWTTMPIESQKVVSKLWTYWELSNDSSYKHTSISVIRDCTGVLVPEFFWGDKKNEQLGWVPIPVDTSPLVQWLVDSGIAEDERFLLHYWW